MTCEFEMSMDGELNFFLGLQVRQREDGIFISQSMYAREIMKKFSLERAKHASTPMSVSTKLCKDASGKDVQQTLYRSMIGKLLYLTANRPDIAFSVGVYARFQAFPKEFHLTTVKRIIKYVRGTLDYGIWYYFDTNACLFAFSDADQVGNVVDRKSAFGGCFFMGTSLVSWNSKKQNCVSLSTVEDEYVAAGSYCMQLLWKKRMLSDYGINQGTMVVYCDNTSTIQISENPVQHFRTKHIEIRYH